MGNLVPNFEDTTGSKSKHRPISNIAEWLQVFAMYVFIISRKQPQQVPDLMGYWILMLEASTEYMKTTVGSLMTGILGNKQPLSQTASGLVLILLVGANKPVQTLLQPISSVKKIASFYQAKCPACLNHDNYPLTDSSFAGTGMSNKVRDALSRIVATNMSATIVLIIPQSLISIIRPCFAQIIPISSWRHLVSLSPYFHELMLPGTIRVLMDTVN